MMHNFVYGFLNLRLVLLTELQHIFPHHRVPKEVILGCDAGGNGYPW